MNLNQIYYYVTVCECESFSKAAEKAFVAQSTLSKQIAVLESELGLHLIDRQKSGRFSLTPAGEEYLKSFHRILDELDDASFRAHFGRHRKKRLYRIAALDGWMLHRLIGAITAVLDARYPEVELRFEFHAPRILNDLRERNALDLCLTTGGSYRPVGAYSHEQLAEATGLICLSAKNIHIANGVIDIPALHREPLYALPILGLPRANLEASFAAMGGRDLLFTERSSIHAVNMSVLSGNGYCFSDQWSAVAYDGRFYTQVLPGMARTVLLCRREDDYSALTEDVCACVKAFAAAPDFSL